MANQEYYDNGAGYPPQQPPQDYGYGYAGSQPLGYAAPPPAPDYGQGQYAGSPYPPPQPYQPSPLADPYQQAPQPSYNANGQYLYSGGQLAPYGTANHQYTAYSPTPEVGYSAPSPQPPVPVSHEQVAYDQHGTSADGEADRGLKATLLGSASGAFVAHKIGSGALGTIGGIIAGAVGANMLEDKHDKKKKDKKHHRHDHHHSPSYGSSHGGSSYGGSHFSGSSYLSSGSAAVSGLYPPSSSHHSSKHGKHGKHKKRHSRSRSRSRGINSGSGSSSDSD